MPKKRAKTQSKRKFSSEKLKSRMFQSGLRMAFCNVLEVRPHIHRISWTTKYPFEKIVEALEKKFETTPIDHSSNATKSIYKLEGSTSALGLNFHILTGFKKQMKMNRFSFISAVPKSPIKPACHRNMIYDLHNRFLGGEVILSKIELALDLFHVEPEQVRDTFNDCLQTVYLPYIRNTNCVKIEDNSIILGRKSNILYRIGEKNKIYERGEDKDRYRFSYDVNGKLRNVMGWPWEVLHIVRFERTMNRSDLYRLKINNLLDLVLQKQPLHPLKDHFQFKYIYRGKNKYQYSCLMDEVLRIKWPKNYLSKIPSTGNIGRLQEEIYWAIEEYHHDWAKCEDN